VVVAPSLVPKKPGDRIKTDRRDARLLARLLRAGELTPVWVPDEDHKALRDLVRAREDAREDRQRKRNQLGKFLLRLGLHPPTGVRAWTVRYRQWLDRLELERPAQQIVLREYIYALDEAGARLKRLEQQLETLAEASEQAPLLAALQALRGVRIVTAATLVAELGDITRFGSPKQLMSYAGLVPSEDSSGTRQRRGRITKSGNAHVRRVTVEAAWHYRHPPRVSQTLRKRQEAVPQTVRDISWKAQQRLNGKFQRLVYRGKPSQKAVVAAARELLGFIWALAHEVASVEQTAIAAN
jgi:transposase